MRFATATMAQVQQAALQERSPCYDRRRQDCRGGWDRMSRLFERYMKHLERGAGAEPEAFSADDVAESVAVLLKQMVLADGIEREEELAAAEAILRRNYSGILGQQTTGIDETLAVLDTTRNESVFPVCRILLTALEAPEIDRLRKQLMDIAMADGQLHPYEKDLLDLFDQLTASPGSQPGDGKGEADGSGSSAG